MAAVKLCFVVCVLVALAVNFADGASSPAASAPAVDCSSLILNMADCLSFVSNDSTTTKPEGTCCTGLKTVLKANADCLCQAFKSSAQLGVVLNVTKALSLPAACKVSAPAAANCKLADSPAGAPDAALAPKASPGSSTAASPETGVNEPTAAPAPSPGKSGSSALIGSTVGTLIVGFAVALFHSF